MNKVFVIIVHFGKIGLTVECLESIYKASTVRVIVINNSLDRDLGSELKKFSNVTLINPKRNLGFARANNLGIREALLSGADYLILLNNDTLVPPGFFEKLLKFAETSPKLQITSPKIYFAKGFEFHKNRYKKHESGKIIWYAGGKIDWNNIYASHRGIDEFDNGQYDRVTETDFTTGCCLLIPKEVITKIGLLDENYFLYYEDVDYSQKAKKKGIKIIYYPFAFVYHKNAGSSQGPGSRLHEYYQTRNRLIFGFRYAPLRNKLPLIKEGMRFLISGGIKKTAVADYFLHRYGKREI